MILNTFISSHFKNIFAMFNKPSQFNSRASQAHQDTHQVVWNGPNCKRARFYRHSPLQYHHYCGALWEALWVPLFVTIPNLLTSSNHSLCLKSLNYFTNFIFLGFNLTLYVQNLFYLLKWSLTKYILTKGVSYKKKSVNSFPQINIQNKATK